MTRSSSPAFPRRRHSVKRTARVRWFRRVFRFVWAIPVFVILPLSLIGLGLPTVMWYFVLVGWIIGTEHIFVGIGAAPADAYGWWASLVIYLVACFVLGTVWHFLAERWFPEPGEGSAEP